MTLTLMPTARCGQVYDRLPCACDDLCPVYDDCCTDFPTFCPYLAIAITSPGNVSRVARSTDNIPERTVSSTSSINESNTHTRRAPGSLNQPERDVIPTHKPSRSDVTTAVFNRNAADDVSSGAVFVKNESLHDVSIALNLSEEGSADSKRFLLRSSKAISQEQAEDPNPSIDKDDHLSPAEKEGGNGSSIRLIDLLGTVRCRHHTRLISTCPSPPHPLPTSPLRFGGKLIKESEVVRRCDTPLEESEDEDVLQAIPVTDGESGHHMANIYCLLCHGGKPIHARPWRLATVWNWKQLKEEDREPTQLRELLSLTRDLQPPTLAVPPTGVTPRRCLSSGFFLPLHCSCPHLREACEASKDGYVQYLRNLFRNPACMLCWFIDGQAGAVGNYHHVCLLLVCFTSQQHAGVSQQHAGVSQGRICFTSQQHAGVSQQHAGVSQGRICFTSQQHAGVSQQHAGVSQGRICFTSQQHAGVSQGRICFTSQQHAGVSQQHAGVSQGRICFTSQQHAGVSQGRICFTSQQHAGVSQGRICFTSQQHAGVSQGRICPDECVADRPFDLSRLQYTDTGPTSSSADPITPDGWQGSHWSVNY